jgi:Phosphatidylinositol-4-phosphate 5-Kinase
VDRRFADLIVFLSGSLFLWVGQQGTPMLVQPHSKIILREAIKSDTEFLSKSNIMDYSYVLFFSIVDLV